jgi:quercetin dioxygenase-like cupin family protein
VVIGASTGLVVNEPRRLCVFAIAQQSRGEGPLRGWRSARSDGWAAQESQMSTGTATIPPAEALPLQSLIASTEQGIASRVLARTGGGNLTLFAMDAGQGLTEHTSPFDALVLVLEGTLTLTIGGTPVRATPGTIVRMPAHVPHALDAVEPARMLLVMLRDVKVS